MHPLFKSSSGILAYIAAWIPLGAMLCFMVGTVGHLKWNESVGLAIPTTLVLALVCLSPWYLCRSLPLKRTPRWKLVTHHAVAAMCASGLVLAIVPVFVTTIDRVHPGFETRFQPARPVLAGLCFLFYLLSIALHYVLQAVETSRQAELLSREAELKALKAQINPHFLFNSLNSISALTSIDPSKARNMCIRLSDFLRNSLRLGERTSIPFGEELALTGNYLDVEQIRFGQRLHVRQDFEPACSNCQVPPLLLQPLVENAIKHGIATLSEGGEISMTARVERDLLRFVVENPFDPEAPSQGKSGFGLVNVRNRLIARYGNTARLDIQIADFRYRVVLSLPCAAPKESGK